jgi:hypothetical protein
MCAALFARANKIENCKTSARSIGARRVCVARMVKVHAVPGDAEDTILRVALTATFKFDDNCFCLCHCVSATDQMQFFADAPLSPNMRTQI